ncbi:acyl-CoA dehydrogenase NM domain-like protein [Schizopora paradoxa]|uniref:Acyl-CoA dehydrogenase NM domain-like protein n=1 Tax=Schizopora paradoxa TaxID=27342 RepID=A0A0H2RV53_9AGAM|nr:acyl-CoA dehydrogenase NM domain-like protein [Schizopora paradoxa]
MCAVDLPAVILLSMQYNLVAGTLAPYAESRPDLRPLLDRILNYEVLGSFLLTEIAHGLDAKNLETTARLLPSGDYDLHSPRFEASKFMPPSGVVEGLDRVAIVFARLLVQGEDRGIRPFVVYLSKNGRMCKGVTSRLMPGRPGSEALDHSITTFTRVRLPRTALLGSHDRPANDRDNFLSCIHRVSIGSIAVSLMSIPTLSVSTFIAAKYSLQRTVTSNSSEQVPIWSFRTQQIPIIRAYALLAVMKSFAREVIAMYTRPGIDSTVKSALVCIVKAFLVQQSQDRMLEMAERCGAQGLFLHNQIASLQLCMRGALIAEGDVLVLCIRLASELLIGRYEIPVPRCPQSFLARYEKAFFALCKENLSEIKDHRSEQFNQQILPLCRPLVEAISHRMAYEAALDSGTVDRPLLDLYEITTICNYGAWFAEQKELDMSAKKLMELEEMAVSAAVPHLKRYMEESEAEAYVQAPMLVRENNEAFINGLECSSGDDLQGVLADMYKNAFSHIPSRL